MLPEVQKLVENVQMPKIQMRHFGWFSNTVKLFSFFEPFSCILDTYAWNVSLTFNGLVKHYFPTKRSSFEEKTHRVIESGSPYWRPAKDMNKLKLLTTIRFSFSSPFFAKEWIVEGLLQGDQTSFVKDTLKSEITNIEWIIYSLTIKFH